MKSLFIAGNWKCNKTIAEARDWLQAFKNQSPLPANATIVLCVPCTLLNFLKAELPIALGAQNVSPFPDGAYTGEVSAKMIKELADWVIIGHSERRKYFGETDEVLKEKVVRAKEVGLKIIYCVSDDKTAVPDGIDVVAYEPVWAIGTGKTDTPDNANHVIEMIKKKSRVTTVIYGGSVTPDNVASFVRELSIDGVLPGGASLHPEIFFQLISAAS